MFYELPDIYTATKMAMWADNVKFVKDIIDSKYQKIDAAAAEVEENTNHEQYKPNISRLMRVQRPS
jgi:hypothetical protein